MLKLPAGLTLYFTRHGETQANVEKRFQGKTDTPLTARGREQAQEIAATLKRIAPDFAALTYVCSPFRRARTTMELIRGGLGLPRDDFTTDPRIVEIDLGSWDGLTDTEAKALNPTAFENRMTHKGTVRVPGGGESYGDVAKRLESWIGDLKTDTFAVSHGAATRILRGLFQGLSWDQMSALDEKQGVVFRVRDGALDRFDPASSPPR
ncbi:MAG TPA: histidine phosphatase family protein [Rhizomicrobium sp.]